LASILIVKKMTVPGKKNLPIRARYHVRWERGRGRPVIHLGVFDTETLAKRRVRAAHDQLARGEVPTADPLEFIPAAPRQLSEIADRWLERRIGIADSTRLAHENSIVHINKRFGDLDPATITVDDVQDWIIELAAGGAKLNTIRGYRSALKQILTHAKVKANPAADGEIELPRSGPKRNRLPSKRDLDLFYRKLAAMSDGKYVGVVKLMEHSGLRVHEAVAVRHEDWDRRKRRLLVPDSKTYAGERFVDQIDGLPEMPPAGASGRVWPNVTISGIQAAMARACDQALVSRFSPHDLRKLHISRCLRAGMDPSLLAVRAGHSSPNITLSTYSKLIPPD
jgi:integrase